jgi:hypothetical protein
MEFISGNVYNGQWRRNKFHGLGKMLYATGTVQLYEGEWSDNMKSGKGNLYFCNGDGFEGIFKDDLVSLSIPFSSRFSYQSKDERTRSIHLRKRPSRYGPLD